MNAAVKHESGRPGSNRRPEPWQGSALPTALRPHAPLENQRAGGEIYRISKKQPIPHLSSRKKRGS